MAVTEWITPPTFADATLLSASAMNIIAHDIELLKGVVDGHQPLFVGWLTNSDDAYRMVFYKHANLDYLYYWFHIEGGTGHDIQLFISAAQASGWGSDWWAAESYGSLAGPVTKQAYTDISSLTDDTWYMLSFDVNHGTATTTRLYRMELMSTNSP